MNKSNNKAPSMKITVAKSAGFCFGVKRAIKIALEAAVKSKQVEMLGDIVHNEDVVKQIEESGITKINNLKTSKNKTLLIRAHGEGKKTIECAKKLGYTLVDATCPMVKGIHKIAKDMDQKGYHLIIIGDKKHDEVQGIIGHIKSEAIVIESDECIPHEKIKKINKAAIIVQSTQTMENVNNILIFLKKYIGNLKYFNTICKPTRTKQKEIKLLPLENDVVLIIGSKTSANTRRLYEISRSLNSRSYWIKSCTDIKAAWFKNAKKVGITAGASTPEQTIKKVVDHLKNSF